MSEAIKAFQTLYSNSKISLIILKGNLSYVIYQIVGKELRLIFLSVLGQNYYRVYHKDQFEDQFCSIYT